MLKTVVKSALAASLAAGGLIAVSAGVASAAAVTVTAGAGSSLSCGLNATAKLTPALKNGWTKTTTDTIPAVNSLPTTAFAAAGPVALASKGTGTGCTGTAKEGSVTSSITAYKLATTAVSGTGSTDPASCANLISDSASSTQKFDSTISWTGSPNKIAPTTITDQGLSVSTSPAGFEFSGGTITGSFAGGSVTAVAAVSSALISAVTQPQETGAEALAKSYTSLGCEPTLKVKAVSSKLPNGSAALTAPKGLKEIIVSTADGSTLSASR
jgi:hypothetical protein